MKENIHPLALTGTVDTCPHCGYTDGFHVSFHQNTDAIKIVLICPNCHYRYNPYWNMTPSKEG